MERLAEKKAELKLKDCRSRQLTQTSGMAAFRKPVTDMARIRRFRTAFVYCLLAAVLSLVFSSPTMAIGMPGLCHHIVSHQALTKKSDNVTRSPIGGDGGQVSLFCQTACKACVAILPTDFLIASKGEFDYAHADPVILSSLSIPPPLDPPKFFFCIPN
jgi:hypothetical protein